MSRALPSWGVRQVRRRLLLAVLPVLAAVTVPLAVPLAHAGNTATVPRHVFVLDSSWVDAVTSTQFNGLRQPGTLLPSIDRYEPGGGLQGTITAAPFVRYRLWVSQLMYGLTDTLTLAVAAPLVTSTTIDPNLGWQSGVYQPALGRPYSGQDFWQWAKSMGQPRPGRFDGNHYTWADLVLGLRWRLPEPQWLQAAGLRAAVAAQVALPTGKAADPEDLVASGTTVWDLNNYGDLEVHLALDRPWLVDGVSRFNLGIDVWYAWLREREMVTPTGRDNPLLLTFAPYVGKTWRLDPGDFFGTQLLVEAVPWVGPTYATFISKGSLDKARQFPPLLTLVASLSHIRVSQTWFHSQSPVWSWDREKLWQPGDKNTIRLGADVSLLRLGLPLQLYANYRDQEWLPGRNTRASNVWSLGARLILKFW